MKATRPLRNTRQRAAIRRVFERCNRPLSLLEVLELARKEVPKLGIATVYRNLKSLVKQRWLAQVNLPGGAVRYELANKVHHHHFQCERCGRVFDIQHCTPEVNELGESDFLLHGHEVLFFGLCPQCRPRSRN